MAKPKKEAFFWTSYSDLMTNLFFVMLVLFVLTILILHRRIQATQEQLDKIQEIENAVNNIDSTYFDYVVDYKKHILTIEVGFAVNQFEKSHIDPQEAIEQLIQAGKSIKISIDSLSSKYPEIQYLLVIEGQASKDNASDQHNYELSYKRAYTLKKIWDEEDIDFGKNCEVLTSGSGTGGTMRDKKEEAKNQRFLIHIIPKPGIINKSK